MQINKQPEELRNGYKDKARLAAISAMPCIVCKNIGMNQVFKTDCHHLTGCGMGLKASDLLTIPLCQFHHTRGGKGEAVHSGVKSFEARFGSQNELLEQVNKILENDK